MIAPLLIAKGGARAPAFVEVGGLPIGTALTGVYREATVRLSPGDTLLFLSDGIVEAHNRAGEIYGFERLEELAAGLSPELSVSELAQQILAAVLAFVGGADPHDDITIIAVRPPAGARVELASDEDEVPAAALL
jgi:serine phosphatase RsbU (regulator of sigma subunit)